MRIIASPYPSMPKNTSSSHREENCFNLLARQMVCAVHIDCSQICGSRSTLRLKGKLSVGYIDDSSYLQGETFDECQEHVIDTVNIFQDLEFTIHPEKSMFVPTRKLTFLEFIWILNQCVSP